MTYEFKLELYKKGHYVFAAPPVTHAQWGDEDWVRYIDSCNGWRPKEK